MNKSLLIVSLIVCSMSLIHAAPYGQQETFMAAPATTFINHDMGISLGSSNSYGSQQLSVSAPAIQQTFEAPAVQAYSAPALAASAPAYSAPALVASAPAYSAPAMTVSAPAYSAPAMTQTFVAAAPQLAVSAGGY